MIAAGAHSPLDRVRAKLEETFGVFELSRTPTPQAGAEEDLVATLTRAIAEHKVVELEYLKPESTEVTTRTVEPYTIERRLPHWYVHAWDVDRDAPRSYRLDRTRKAKALRRGSRRATASTRPSCSSRRRRASGTRRRSPAGRSRRARSRWSTAPPCPSARSAARSGCRRGALVPRRGRHPRAGRAADARRQRGRASSSASCGPRSSTRARRRPRRRGARAHERSVRTGGQRVTEIVREL